MNINVDMCLYKSVFSQGNMVKFSDTTHTRERIDWHLFQYRQIRLFSKSRNVSPLRDWGFKLLDRSEIW